jgi:hypothetical protein
MGSLLERLLECASTREWVITAFRPTKKNGGKDLGKAKPLNTIISLA